MKSFVNFKNFILEMVKCLQLDRGLETNSKIKIMSRIVSKCIHAN